jgi:hypothetical protein
MSWTDVPEFPFQGYDKIWQAAGWTVFTMRNSQEKMVYAIACHYRTGRIVRISINDEMDEHWKKQVFQKLMEVRT